MIFALELKRNNYNIRKRSCFFTLMHKTNRFLSQSDSKWWSMTHFTMYSYYMLPSQTYVNIEQTSQCSMKHQIDSSDVYMWYVCLYLRQMNTDGWSQKTEHLSSSLTNSDWKSISIRLTHNSECLWIAFILLSNFYALCFKLGPLQINHTWDHFSLKPFSGCNSCDYALTPVPVNYIQQVSERSGEIESYLSARQVERREKTTDVTDVHLKQGRLSVLQNTNNIKSLICVLQKHYKWHALVNEENILQNAIARACLT